MRRVPHTRVLIRSRRQGAIQHFSRVDQERQGVLHGGSVEVGIEKGFVRTYLDDGGDARKVVGYGVPAKDLTNVRRCVDRRAREKAGDTGGGSPYRSVTLRQRTVGAAGEVQHDVRRGPPLRVGATRPVHVDDRVPPDGSLHLAIEVVSCAEVAERNNRQAGKPVRQAQTERCQLPDDTGERRFGRLGLDTRLNRIEYVRKTYRFAGLDERHLRFCDCRLRERKFAYFRQIDLESSIHKSRLWSHSYICEVVARDLERSRSVRANAGSASHHHF